MWLSVEERRWNYQQLSDKRPRLALKLLTYIGFNPDTTTLHLTCSLQHRRPKIYSLTSFLDNRSGGQHTTITTINTLLSIQYSIFSEMIICLSTVSLALSSFPGAMHHMCIQIFLLVHLWLTHLMPSFYLLDAFFLLAWWHWLIDGALRLMKWK